MQRLFTIMLGLPLVLSSACSLQTLVPRSLETIWQPPIEKRETIAQPPIEKRETIAPPLIEKRETLTATGYAVISIQNHRLPAQQRLLAIRAAKIDAYRGLAEQVYGLYLDANTIVSDMTIVSDAFRTRVEGVIFGATVTSINPLNNDTYEVTLSLNKSSINDLRVLYAEQLSGKRR